MRRKWFSLKNKVEKQFTEGKRKRKGGEKKHLKLSDHQNHLGSWLKIQIPKLTPSH